jgi:coenzyme F420-0:L-glutamate ligase/coenzyme F420-1:gamma-L-glutamate ligase
MTIETKLASAIGQRRSVRRYSAAALDEAVIERLLIAATKAPSAHNRQPWRFAVLDDKESKHKLATAMGHRLRQDRTTDGDDPPAIEADVARSYARLTEAPLVIVASVDTTDMDRYPDKPRSDAEHLMAVQSTAMAMQNLLLAAQSEGLGACVMCAPLFCPDVVVEALALPAGWQPQMLATIGSPANGGKERARLSLRDVVLWLRRDRA